jgi:hypothetical protein
MSTKDTPLSISNVRSDLEEIQAKVAELQSSVASLDSTLAGLTDEAELAAQPLNLKGIARFANRISALATQDKILQGILEETREYVDRAAFFLEYESGYRSWKGFGFTADTLENLLLEDPNDPIVNAAQEKTLIQIEGDLGEKLSWLSSGSGIVRNAVCIPLVFKNTVPIVFYGDASGPIDVGTLELLTQVSVLVLQNHYLTHLIQQKTEPVDSRWPVLETREPTSVAAPEPRPGIVLPPPVATETQEAPEETPSEDEFRGEVQPAEVENVPVETQVKEGPPPEAPAEEAPSLETAPEESVEGAEEGEPASQEEQLPEIILPDLEEVEHRDSERSEAEEGAPSPPEQAGAGEMEDQEATGPSEVTQDSPEEGEPEEKDAEEEPPAIELTQEEEEHAHAEARRFARLLVTEIKLYNEEAVSEGRTANDLYTRLQADIDRSREMYEKRAHPLVQEKIDYFHEQLVSILAQEEPSRMGHEYPGAQFKDGDDIHL